MVTLVVFQLEWGIGTAVCPLVHGQCVGIVCFLVGQINSRVRAIDSTIFQRENRTEDCPILSNSITISIKINNGILQYYILLSTNNDTACFFWR